MNIEVLWDGTYGLSSLSEKTRKSIRLQMSLQRQHFLLSYLKTLSVGPAGVRTYDLPHGSPVLNQLSQPVGDCDSQRKQEYHAWQVKKSQEYGFWKNKIKIHHFI